MSRLTQETAAGGAGAVFGTVLLAVIRALPDETPGKTIATLAAPSIGVGVSLLARMAVRMLDTRLRHRRILLRFEEAMIHQRAILHDVSASREEKAEAREELSRLGRQRTIYMRDRITEDELADLRQYPVLVSDIPDAEDEPLTR